MKTIENIEKELISQLKFSKIDVLEHAEDIKRRSFDLNRAQTLGNLLKNKVSITFQDNEKKTYRVHTTIWAVGSDFVCLKADICIPIKSILEVE